ncbi:bifunctional UDP-N-acetylglucosamine diphosphorylase/glucosamine-1-phosphate N-acetyltransferase GlmU [Sporomusa acidovorans]|uniref:Bifunctional protein GlmU n=1 Tax=Sporomusa acidovorans (strain ATCC 49682 / DSM 3132 / Mol) TaxID=1123286 RepID=A0ABZ3IWA3_SPOA4|nr:bifunctional UDP-N-acetylglucosamine diphosphorylase/glucosamine-1-phosphate N-acetyltransferase GlmU [Sporomusa acidovorans]OZC23576.1 bifunctional protein GlmU [Sporomusa acidovorans DSM 3132]SDE21449.1 bifunctional UDP-N-acetylglucosamine pyrophosphorylase / Glucosamine-1-phosphate N-acetyltransferase [Sporomusa acidovorans]
MSNLMAIILAAGKGTRMKSALPKVLHQVGGKPMVRQVLDAAAFAGADKKVVVIGFGAQTVAEALAGQAEFVVQTEQLGTGHAVMQAKKQLAAFAGTVMVLCGDTPLLTGGLLSELYAEHNKQQAAATVLTAVMPDPAGYGRVIRNQAGQVEKIVEHKDASPAELSVSEINTGIYCFEAGKLLAALDGLTCDNAQGEYYLTDVIAILNKQAQKVWAVTAGDYRETLGINSRLQLAEAESIIRRRKLEALMESGVTIMDPNSTFIDLQVEIAPDTIIYPFTWIEGQSKIGANSLIGPNTRLTNTIVGNNTTIHFSYAHDCTVGSHVILGPYVHLRPDTCLQDGVKVGNFVEVKNSVVGEKSKIPHLSYIGDTDMGAGVNIGSGTITVNYDGKLKHRTTIEDDAFIGCNTNLVAPVKVGSGSYVAAGSTITKNVPPGSLGVARARQNNIEGWAEKQRR